MLYSIVEVSALLSLTICYNTFSLSDKMIFIDVAKKLTVFESGGGGLTLTWYTYMCLPFGSLFHEIWYSDRGVFIRDEGAQIT